MQHALERAAEWGAGWRRSGRLVLLLDFDGTLAPIVERPERAAIPPETRRALDGLRTLPGVEVAVVSGRGMADVRERAALGPIAYAGNHGMEIHGAGIERIHPQAAAARPLLERAAGRIEARLAAIGGAFLEDKGLTLSVHYRQAPDRADEVRRVVDDAAGGEAELKVTAGKMVLEVRPRVEWDKGKAVLFLLDQMRPPAGAPVLYLGDDATDEDAFRALAGWREEGEGVLVADAPPAGSAARAWLRSPEEVGALFAALDQGHGER